ncbi:unnamed protein product [Protopolystoma xenopodis]|uniref:SAM-dependent MTase RsmB/NOP-type domain-containing protein n=1 Tax=Protopolystoma xenopodis TaxID=117903 RepID=A0A448XFA9_9PLAT|nr:unnamed protein product [Protopolystoma xenopodis]
MKILVLSNLCLFPHWHLCSDLLVSTDNKSVRLDRLFSVLSTHGPGLGVNRPGLPDVCIMHINQLDEWRRRRVLQPSLNSAHHSENSVNDFAPRGTDNLFHFDRVLVDVPCSTDRTALTGDMGSLFSRGNAKLRINLPDVQLGLLRYIN